MFTAMKWRKKCRKHSLQHLAAIIVTSSILIMVLGGCASHVSSYNSASDVTVSTVVQKKLWHQANEFEEALINLDQVIYEDSLVNYMQSIMDKLFPEFEGTIRVKVLNNHNLNAFALPNGSVYVHTGMLSALENEAQLATVLAHEGMHFVHRHGEKSYHIFHQSAGFSIFAAAMGIPLISEFGALSVISGYSVSFENEADADGFKRLKAAGYDVRESTHAFQKLADEAKARNVTASSLFASHPKLQSRIANFEQLIEESAAVNGANFGRIGRMEYNRFVMQLRDDVLKSKLESGQYDVLIDVIAAHKDKSMYPKTVYYYIAEAYRLRGKAEDRQLLVQTFDTAEQQLPDFAPLYRSIGEYHLKFGNKTLAKQYFEKYLSLDTEATDASFIQHYIEAL